MDREKLVEAMADVLLNGGCGTTTECEALARSALAVAEPVVREWCAALADAVANELDATGEAMHKQGISPTGMLGRGVYQLRAMSVRDVATDIRTGGTP